MKNKKFWIILCIIIGVWNIYKSSDIDDINLIKEKGSFCDIVLNEYEDKPFNNMFIEKTYNDARDYRYNGSNVKVLNDVMYMFKNLEIIEINRKDIPNELSSIYEICFKQSITYARLRIEIFNEEYLIIWQSFKVKNIDEENKIISYDSKRKHKAYKITNSKLDLDYIEKVFLSLNKQ